MTEEDKEECEVYVKRLAELLAHGNLLCDTPDNTPDEESEEIAALQEEVRLQRFKADEVERENRRLLSIVDRLRAEKRAARAWQPQPPAPSGVKNRLYKGRKYVP